MPERSMTEILDAIGDEFISEFDEITRAAHSRYRSYRPEDLIEHDVRAQAACTYAHMVAEGDRRFIGRPRVRTMDLRGLKLWHFEDADVVVRLKKMDEDGRTRNYPTKQAKDFDRQLELPGLPSPPIRLTAGYVLDATGTGLVRSQIAMPAGRDALWCVAIVPREERVSGERIWIDATRQARAF
ncbi:hypothetical protein [Mesorhizobium carmichaelinearum]|uniref:hypothetical protein n=1 Tax=Mesorhizobium carmichaelinearum TaxID=1208188 RepID=UPI00118162B7|nr:hypothetical protein [Mesorhizobium carmichaelinearum]